MICVGSHVSVAGGLEKGIQRAVDLNCDCIQIFSKNNNRWSAKPLTDTAIKGWKDALSASSLTHPIAHASYLINMATPKDDLFQKSIDALVDEMERANALGLEGLVVHPGAYTDSSEADGINRIVDAVAETLGRVDPGSCRLLLENTAGQGTCLGYTLEQLAQMLDGIGDDHRVGICLDTCHAFAAGYEINTTDGFAEMRSEIDGFRNLFADPRLGSLPGYLETEKGTDEESGEDWDAINLRVLRDLVPQST